MFGAVRFEQGEDMFGAVRSEQACRRVVPSVDSGDESCPTANHCVVQYLWGLVVFDFPQLGPYPADELVDSAGVVARCAWHHSPDFGCPHAGFGPLSGPVDRFPVRVEEFVVAGHRASPFMTSSTRSAHSD